jgi:positive regulator of sigma E activity
MRHGEYIRPEMDEKGIVVERGRGTARVRIRPSPSCEGCGICRFSPDMMTEAIDMLGVSPGDVVRIVTRAVAPLTASLVLFGLPLLLLFGGYAAGSALARAAGASSLAQGAGIGGAALFLCLSFLLMSVVNGRMPGGRLGRSVIVEVIGRQDPR